MAERDTVAVPYSKSFPLTRWLGHRRESISALAQAHAQFVRAGGPGRPLEIGRPVAHAYVLRVVAEFQAFVRDLHDLGAERMVALSNADVATQAMLITATTEGRMIDRGNADMRSIKQDFRRIGVRNVSQGIAGHNPRWDNSAARRGDQAFYQDLIELRNALAHGDQRQLGELRVRGVFDRSYLGTRQAARPGPHRTCAGSGRVGSSS